MCMWKLSENVGLLIVNEYDKSKYSLSCGYHGRKGWGWGGGVYSINKISDRNVLYSGSSTFSKQV